MAGPAARVEDLQLRTGSGPTRENVGSRTPGGRLGFRLSDKSKKAPIDSRKRQLAAKLSFRLGGGEVLGSQTLSGPPSAERVVDQELHHIRLGEELGDCGDLP